MSIDDDKNYDDTFIGIKAKNLSVFFCIENWPLNYEHNGVRRKILCHMNEE